MDDYSQQWSKFRKLRNWGLLALVAFIPWLTLVGLAVQRFLWPDGVFLAVSLLCVAGLTVPWTRLALFRCPRCGKRFFTTMWYRNPFARKCVHCGLPKYSNG
jgi:hypothetical protein